MNITCFIRFLFLFMLIGSIIGLSMPQYKTESPVICKVENRNADDLALDKQWEIAQKSGLYEGSIRKNGKLLGDGSSLLTGYFAESAALGELI